MHGVHVHVPEEHLPDVAQQLRARQWGLQVLELEPPQQVLEALEDRYQ